MRSGIPILVVGTFAMSVLGCTSYYQVTDPTSGKTYYTEDMYQERGAVHLKDGKTGNAVTVQNSEVRSISKEEFEVKRAEP
jgi:hypothetical protein